MVTSRALAPNDIVDLGYEYNLLAGPLAIDNTGATDCSTALQAALDAVAANVLWTMPSTYGVEDDVPVCAKAVLPPGDYKINTGLTLPRGVSLEIQEGARIRAGAAMSVLLDTELSELYQKQSLTCRGVLDCNELADIGFYARYFANFRIDGITVFSPVDKGLVLGDTNASSTSYEPVVRNVDIWRPKGNGVPAGSIGVHAQHVTDGEFSLGHIVSTETGMRFDRGGHTVSQFHPWCFADEDMDVCFDDRGTGNTYIGCTADSPADYGWRLAGSGTRMDSCRAYRNINLGDDVGVAVYLTGDVSAPQHFIWGLRVAATSSSARWSQDFDAATPADMLTVTYLVMRPHVVTNWGAMIQIGGVSGASVVDLISPDTDKTDAISILKRAS